MNRVRNGLAFAYKLWMRFARALGVVNTHVLLTLVFILIIGPFALVVRLFGKDFLDRTLRPSGSYWKPKEPAPHDFENAKRQF